jgi:signal transduction histidine kinase
MESVLTRATGGLRLSPSGNMLKKSGPHIAIPLLSAVFSILSFLLFLRGRPVFPVEWQNDFAILLSISLVLTFVLAVVRNARVVWALLLIKASIFLLLSVPLTGVAGVCTLLFSSVLMEIGLYLSLPFSLSSIGLLALVFVLRQEPGRAFGVALPQSSALDSLTVLVVSLSFAGLAVLLRFATNELSAERQANARLNSSVEKLTKANSEFLQYASVVERESVVSERNRITRDLHDTVGQALTNIIMMMDAALHLAPATPEEMSKLFRWTREQAQNCLEETRAALYALRSIPQGDFGGIKSIKRLIDTYSGLTAVKVRVEWGNLPWALDDAIGQAVYRLIQESLSNSFRHGMATLVEVHFQVDQGILNLLIRDNGRGGDVAKKGIGHTGMEERVRKLRGDIAFRREASGYLVLARIPLLQEIANGAS